MYVWVFRPSDGALLIQRRSPAKKIGAAQLDLSVAEHLQPGETYRQGALRGLWEELGIAVDPSTPPAAAAAAAAADGRRERVECGATTTTSGAVVLSGPLAPTHRRELHQGLFHDVELVQSFRCVSGVLGVRGGRGMGGRRGGPNTELTSSSSRGDEGAWRQVCRSKQEGACVCMASESIAGTPLACRAAPPLLHASHHRHCHPALRRRLDGYDGDIRLDDGEVAETRWVALAELRRHVEERPEEYTEVGAGGWMVGSVCGGGGGARVLNSFKTRLSESCCSCSCRHLDRRRSGSTTRCARWRGLAAAAGAAGAVATVMQRQQWQ